MGYTGVSVGWVWGFGDSVAHQNRIEFNHIHDLGRGLLSDMGGVYLLGRQPGTVVRNNLIHDILRAKYGACGIYPDEGASHILIENNVCHRIVGHVFNLHVGCDITVRNNIFAFGPAGLASVGRHIRQGRDYIDRGEAPLQAKYDHNLFITDGQPVFVGGLANDSGDLEHGHFQSDRNLFWDMSGGPIISGNASHGKRGIENLRRAFDWSQWQALGHDAHSIVADPLCRDPRNGDFTLAPDSPALALGFEPIDLSGVGPRAD